MLPTFSVAIFIALFYGLQSKPESAAIYSTTQSLSEQILPFYSFNFFVYDTVKYIKHYILYVPYFIPFTALCAYYYMQNKTQFLELWNTYKFFILFFGISVICGYILSFFFYPVARYDNMQLITLTSTVLLNIFVFLSFLYVFSKLSNNTFYNTFFIVFVAASMMYNVFVFYSTKNHLQIYPETIRSKRYIADVKNYFSNKKASIYGARIQDTTEFSRIDKASSRSELMNAYWFSPFSTQIDFLYTTSLNTTYVLETNTVLPINKPEERLDLSWEQNTAKILAQAPFSIFSHKYILEHGYTHIDTLQYNFVKKFDISYLILSKTAQLPDIFSSMLDTIFVDCYSGERFVFLSGNNVGRVQH